MNEDLVMLELNARWGCDISFGWIPVTGDQKIPDTEIYDAGYFDHFAKDVKAVVKRIYGANEVFEIPEGGVVSIQLLDNCFLGYDGLEHLYTNFSFDFVLYFSHENSVTVGGKQLIDEIHRLWPEHKNHFWTDLS